MTVTGSDGVTPLCASASLRLCASAPLRLCVKQFKRRNHVNRVLSPRREGAKNVHHEGKTRSFLRALRVLRG